MILQALTLKSLNIYWAPIYEVLVPALEVK